MITLTHSANLLLLASSTRAWVPQRVPHWSTTTALRPSTTSNSPTQLDAAVGIFFGTSTGSTQECADLLYDAFGDSVAAEPVDVDTLEAGALAQILDAHDALVVGTPTWNTGADTERSGTGWDELYADSLPAAATVLRNKKVAVFGLGDQISYAENYADAAGELYDVFATLGCDMVPYAATSQEGYEHEDSKSIREGKFCGLLLDQVNQDDLSAERVATWVSRLIEGGFTADAGKGSTATTVEVPPVEAEIMDFTAIPTLDESSEVLEENIRVHNAVGGYTPHFNPVTEKTMWTSPDGRSSYVTTTEVPTKLRP